MAYCPFYPLEALIYVLSELTYRERFAAPFLNTETVTRVWKQVDLAYQLHPEWITDTGYTVHVALRNLTLKAWQSRPALSTALRPVTRPVFITEIHSQRVNGRREESHVDSCVSSAINSPEVRVDGTDPTNKAATDTYDPLPVENVEQQNHQQPMEPSYLTSPWEIDPHTNNLS